MRTERRKLMSKWNISLPYEYIKLDFISNENAHAYISVKNINIGENTKWYFKYTITKGNNIFRGNFSYWVDFDNFGMVNISDSSYLLKSAFKVEYGKKVITVIDMQKRTLTQIVDGIKNVETMNNKPLPFKNSFSFMYINNMFNSFGKIYEIKASNPNEELFHGIPCKRKSDGVIGMYDLVGRKFYTSPNGVAFSGGGIHVG